MTNLLAVYNPENAAGQDIKTLEILEAKEINLIRLICSSY